MGITRVLGHGLTRADSACGLITIHLRHLAVHQHDVPAGLLERLDNLHAVGYEVRLEAKFSQ